MATDFPVTAGAFQTKMGNPKFDSGFVTKLNPSGVYHWVDQLPDFPTTSGAMDPTPPDADREVWSGEKLSHAQLELFELEPVANEVIEQPQPLFQHASRG